MEIPQQDLAEDASRTSPSRSTRSAVTPDQAAPGPAVLGAALLAGGPDPWATITLGS